MSMKARSNATTKQKQVSAQAVSNIPMAIGLIMRLAKDADDAIVKLPCVNEEGQSVTHGCNMDMLHMRNHYVKAARALLDAYGDVNEQRDLVKQFKLDEFFRKCGFMV